MKMISIKLPRIVSSIMIPDEENAKRVANQYVKMINEDWKTTYPKIK